MGKMNMDETLDTLSIGNIKLSQATNGYRFSIDPILLSNFVQIKNGDTVVDLGTGVGIIPLLLARLNCTINAVGIELQPKLSERAIRNIDLNSMQERVRIVSADIRSIREFIPSSSVDMVVSNPPYRRLDSGRIAPNDERAAARHELAGGLSDFVEAAKWLLKNGGRFAVVYLSERLPELMITMCAAGIEPKRLRMVHAYQGAASKMVLLEGRKGGSPGLQIEPPLYIYKDGKNRNYTDEVLQMYDR